MIRLDRVELLHWDIQAHQVLPLGSGVTVLTGENGSGKTSVLDGIKVGLGGEIGGDRSVRGYLLKQAASVAMIRILVDNRPEPGTRRRPFDPLGEQSQDLVTLAVVFRAVEEGDYNTDYYILDGDVVPLDTPRRHRPQPSRRDYQQRLQKVGIGRQYLKLLSLPQGQIASFCRKAGPALFDDLFDIIGGRQTLEQWTERLRELQEARNTWQAAERDLKEAARKLELLQGKVRRHEEYQGKCLRLDLHRRAEPWLRLAAIRKEVKRLSVQAEQEDREQRRCDRLATEAESEEAHLSKQIEGLEQEARTLAAETEAARVAWRTAVKAQANGDSRLRELEQKRLVAEGVPVEDIDELRGRQEGLGADLAAGQAKARDRNGERTDLEQQLAQVGRGLLPFPKEVEAFRDRLRSAGIPHHLFAEVVEVQEDAWRPAIEAWFGRLRFAVLVQDPAVWPEAARLAREARYGHGVLAPDVRGSSPVDAEGLFSLLRVSEPRYRALIARLVRPVSVGEPDSPLAPPRLGERLAADGFALSRVEARVAPTDGRWLGRAALEDRRGELELLLGEIRVLDRAWRTEEARIRQELQAVRAAISAQEQRLAWEMVREEHAALRAELQRWEGTLRTLDARRAAAELDQQRISAAIKPLQGGRGAAGERAHGAREARAAAETRLVSLRPQQECAEGELGRLRAGLVGEPEEELAPLLAEGLPLPSVERIIGELEKEIGRFSAEERDTLLPTNAARQAAEVEAVRERLARLEDGLGRTQEAARAAQQQYQETTRRIFRSYWGRLQTAAQQLDFQVEGRLEPREDGRFSCEVRVRVGEKPAVHHDSEDLSGGQKAALSILMGMTAVSLESESAGFFLIDEPFSASDIHKINELGTFLGRTQAQYLLSMPTSSDIERCGDWLQAVWLCTRSRGGHQADGRPRLAPPIKLGFLDHPHHEP